MLDLTWTEDLSVGHPVLDAQHQELIDTMAKLHGTLSGGGSITQAAAILNVLLDQARRHFATEEGLLRQGGYQGLDLHKSTHARMLREIEAFAQQAHHSPETFRSLDVTGFVAHWIVSHIRGDDSMYRDCVSDL